MPTTGATGGTHFRQLQRMRVTRKMPSRIVTVTTLRALDRQDILLRQHHLILRPLAIDDQEQSALTRMSAAPTRRRWLVPKCRQS
jgi:hypothetical protein